MKRRDVLGVVAGGSMGTMLGYYIGAKELLGIQSTRTVVRNGSGATATDAPAGTATTAPGGAGGGDATPADGGGDGSGSGSGSGSSTARFDETFDDGLGDWVVNRRFRTGEDRAPANPPAGDGGYSEQYGGSVRLHVDGGPSTIGVARDVSGLDEGTTIATEFTVGADEPQPGFVGIALFEPDGDDMTDTDGYFLSAYGSGGGRVASGDHRVTGTLPRDYPDGTELRVVADVWPGEFTAYVTRIRVGDPSAGSTATPTASSAAGDYTVDSAPEAVVEAFLRAGAADDHETLRRLSVDEYDPSNAASVDELRIHRLEGYTARAYADRENVSRAEVEDALQSAIREFGGDDATIVTYRLSTSQYDDIARDVILLQQNGNWRLSDFGRLPS